MRTYLPYPSLLDSVQTYDNKTVTKVGHSIIDILRVLHEVPGDVPAASMSSHPEIKKWKGHEPYLCEFGMVLASEKTLHALEDTLVWHLECASAGEFTMAPPAWWGNADYHTAEQSALLRVNFQHYSNHFEGVRMDLAPGWATFRG